MKKNIYLQPITEAIGILPLQLINTSPGWSKDGNPPTEVVKEVEVNENDKLTPTDLWGDDSYGGFLDLD